MSTTIDEMRERLHMPEPTLNADGTINIAGIPKSEVIRRLYNGGNFQPPINTPSGIIAAITPGEMSEEMAQRAVESNTRLYFDYLNGRPMKADISGDVFDPRLYDRDRGAGAAARALGAK